MTDDDSVDDGAVTDGSTPAGRIALRCAWVLVRIALLVALGATRSTFIYERF